MTEQNLNLKKSLRKAKWQQVGKTTLFTIIVLLIIAVPLYLASHRWIQNESNKLADEMEQIETIASPNIHTETRQVSNNFYFHGQVVAERSKNIDGYVVNWSPMIGRYTWFSHEIDNVNESMLVENKKQPYAVDTKTKQKQMTFYHPAVKYDYLPQDLTKLSEMDNQVAEMAISFDKAYTVAEIQNKLPKNLNLVWYRLASSPEKQSNDGSYTKYGVYDAFGLAADTSLKNFLTAAKTYNKDIQNKELAEIIQKNQNKSLKEAKINGIVITGQTKNMIPLTEQNWIKASSIGVTAEIVPYITPEK